VCFTLHPLYPRGKGPRYPLDRRLGGPQSRSALYGEGKILDRTGTRTLDSSVVQPVASTQPRLYVRTSELYLPRDRRLWTKLVPTFVDRGCHMVSVTSL
jgi:hypothetical protein